MEGAEGYTMIPEITADQLNLLVCRYFQEAGFTHSMFIFSREAQLGSNTVDRDRIPVNALVRLVLKGIQYRELEANSNIVPDDEYIILNPMDLIAMEAADLQRIVKEKRENLIKEQSNRGNEGKSSFQGNESDLACHSDMKENEEVAVQETLKGILIKKKQRSVRGRKKRVQFSEKGFGGLDAMEFSAVGCEIIISEVAILRHSSEVHFCSWNPWVSLLASSSAGTAHVWIIPSEPVSSNTKASNIALKHFMGNSDEKINEVTALAWSSDGRLLATGCFDGCVGLWEPCGKLEGTLNLHTGPIFSLKWNKKGNLLLSGSHDDTIIAWDMKTKKYVQKFYSDSAHVVDCDWRNNDSFAFCSTNKNIYVFKIGESKPKKVYSGHKEEVNSIKWNHSGTLLASGSSDKIAKIWSLKKSKSVLDLIGHEKDVCAVRWRPTGLGSKCANKHLMLARLAVHSIAFSPNGEYLASSSADHSLCIWSVKEGKLVKIYNAAGVICQVCWDALGDKVAGVLPDSTVCIINMRK